MCDNQLSIFSGMPLGYKGGTTQKVYLFNKNCGVTVRARHFDIAVSFLVELGLHIKHVSNDMCIMGSYLSYTQMDSDKRDSGMAEWKHFFY